MSTDVDQLSHQLRSLRAEFDRSFSVAPVSVSAGGQQLLAVRVGRDPYALRTSDIAMIGVDRPVTALPSDSPELIGVAGLRGTLLAVYDLAQLIGGSRSEGARWLACCKGSALAFAFSALDGQVRVAPEDVYRSGSGSSALLAEIARVDGVARPIIPLPALVKQLEQRALEHAGRHSL